MQNDNKIEESSEGNDAQKNSGDNLSQPRPPWLPRGLFDAIGPIALFVVIVGGVAAYYAYHYVTKDSVRFQFWVGFMFSFLAFVVLLVQSVIYAQQAEFMNQQSRAMQRSVELTDAIIENMKGQLSAMKQEAAATVMAAETAKRALDITERPYLDVAEFTLKPLPFEAHKPITYTVRILNAGRTPAYDVEGGIYFSIDPTEVRDEDGLEFGPLQEKASKVTIATGRDKTRSSTTSDLDLLPWHIQALDEGRLFLYVYGVENYWDSLTTDAHRLRYCFYYDRHKKRMTVASFHNDSN